MSSWLVTSTWLRVGAICTRGTKRQPALSMRGAGRSAGHGTPVRRTTAFATRPAASATIVSSGTLSPHTAWSVFTSRVAAGGGSAMVTTPRIVPVPCARPGVPAAAASPSAARQAAPHASVDFIIALLYPTGSMGNMGGGAARGPLNRSGRYRRRTAASPRRDAAPA